MTVLFFSRRKPKKPTFILPWEPTPHPETSTTIDGWRFLKDVP